MNSIYCQTCVAIDNYYLWLAKKDCEEENNKDNNDNYDKDDDYQDDDDDSDDDNNDNNDDDDEDNDDNNDNDDNDNDKNVLWNHARAKLWQYVASCKVMTRNTNGYLTYSICRKTWLLPRTRFCSKHVMCTIAGLVNIIQYRGMQVSHNFTLYDRSCSLQTKIDTGSG